MQKTHRAWYRDAPSYRSRDVPWRKNCKRVGSASLEQNQRLANKHDGNIILLGSNCKTGKGQMLETSMFLPVGCHRWKHVAITGLDCP